MTVKKHSIPNLEVRSAVLFAALVVAGGIMSARAQTPATATASPPRPAAQLTSAGTTDAIPHNRTTAKDLDAAFDRADTNHDGKLSRQEAEHFPALAPHFDEFDTNHKGFLSREDFHRAAGSGF
ncbi:EF-hand domain-containing protein [Polaromonas jejuensis]|uniref:EF-hand domain-containing protein n=1 Tax=Polaromonas jejuensis TaxID=457502 RepID=A0ABW0QB49_9BURK|nr:EF-hand domain-containing protein [Polaromonas jejuensis]